jgi:uncharacterized protein YdhG (YjbR/CyaY superfamily)
MHVRPGDTYRFQNAVRVVEAEYGEVEARERLVWTFQNYLQALEFEDLGARRDFAMAERTTARKGTQKATTTTTVNKKSKGFTDEERAAMRARAQELKAEERANKDRAAGESEVLAAIAAMTEPDRAMAKRLHAIVKASAPALSPKTWYGMPAYAKEGKVVCFFQSAQKFKSRYATFGFSDTANLDKGAMWPTAFALNELTAKEEAKIAALVKKAVR